MARSATRDMTVGSPTKLIFGFFIPLVFGTLFQQLYSMVDTIIIGQFLGVDALAGVGSTSSVTFLVLGLIMGICNGFAIPVAQKFGERDFVGLKRYVVNSLILSVGISAVMTVVVCLLCESSLHWMNTPENIFAYAYDYMFVIFLGIPVVFLYNVLFGIIRSLGDSRTPLIYLVISSLLNIGLDLVFILVFHMGAAGAAWATVLSQLAAVLLCVRYMMRCDVVVLRKEDWKMDRQCMGLLLGMGLPMGMQYSITAIGTIVLQSAVNALGSVYVAAVATASKVAQLFTCPYEAMGPTMATYGGQNVGAGKLDRIPKGLRSACVIDIVYSVVIFIVIYFFSDPMWLLFVDASETEVIASARTFLVINAATYTLLGFVNTVRFLIQGMGFTKQAVIAGVCEMFARTAVGLLLVPALGLVGAALASPAAWVAANLFLFPAYFRDLRKLKNAQENPPAA